MKVLLINGSPRPNGCTFYALGELSAQFLLGGVDAEIIQLGNKPIGDCIACGYCAKNGKCYMNDIVNEVAEKAREADGFIFGTPVYYAHPTGRLLSFMDRLFYSAGSVLAHKPAAAIVSARRAGTVASFDVVNKHFTINQMPIVSSTYWNNVHGSKAEDVAQDEEGIQTLANLAQNMIWLMKCIEAGKSSGVMPPETVKDKFTNFIR